jgi:CBS domain-containing protein
MPPVADIMSRELLTIDASGTIGDAARSMVERAVGAVVVVEGDAVVAILTERDVMKAVGSGKDGTAPVAEWMTRHPDTIEPGESTDQAATLMIHGGFRHLPVVEAEKVVGIVSIRDLMQVALDDSSPRGV